MSSLIQIHKKIINWTGVFHIHWALLQPFYNFGLMSKYKQSEFIFQGQVSLSMIFVNKRVQYIKSVNISYHSFQNFIP